jgi:hypothetical protein
VPGFGNVCPGGTGYPPPLVGELATLLVKKTLDVQPVPPAAAVPGTARPDASAALMITILFHIGSALSRWM